MKKILFTAAFSFLVLSAAPVIVIPQNAGLQEKTAAEELALHLKLATGKNIRTVSETAAPVNGKRIFVGKTAFAKKNKVNFAKFEEEEHFVKAVSPNTLIIAGGFPRGTLYGVYEFLENNLNAMWLEADQIKIDKVKSVRWKNGLLLNGKPAFKERSIYNNFTKASIMFKIRNRQNWFHFDIGKKYTAYGIRPLHGSPNFCHTFSGYTKDLPEKDHDILSLSSGKRIQSPTSLGPGQVCYSNPKTAQHFIKKLREWIPADRKGKAAWEYPRIYVIATNDNQNECECKNCRVLVQKHGWMGAKLLFVNKVAREIGKTYPELLFRTDSYGRHREPPKNGVFPEKNVMIDVAYGAAIRDSFRPYSAPENKFARQCYEKWARMAKHLFVWDYWVDTVRTQYPSNNVPVIAENLKFYHKIGVRSFMAECGSAHVTSLWKMRNYIGYRFLVDPSRDLDKEIKRFCDAYYGKGSETMIKFHQLLYKNTNRLKKSIETYTLARRHDLDMPFFNKAEALLAAAEKETAGDKLSHLHVKDEYAAIQWAKIEKFGISDKKYIESFRTNTMNRMRLQQPYNINIAVPKINILCRSALAKVPPLKGFEKASIINDYPWPKLSLARYNQEQKDPLAAGGISFFPGQKAIYKREIKTTQFTCGLYDETKKKYLIRGATMPLESLPKDGKFHWYFLGRCRLDANGLLYLHESWTLQLPVADSYGTPEIFDNDVGIYVSMRAQGALHFVDRVVIVRGDTSRDCPHVYPISPEIDKNKLVSVLAGTSLHGSKKFDKHSLFKCSLPCGKLSAAKSLWTALRDQTGAVKPAAVYVSPQAGKGYQLHTLYKGILTRDFILWIGRQAINLSNYFAMAAPNKKYEIKASLRLDNDKNVFLDGIYIMDAE